MSRNAVFATICLFVLTIAILAGPAQNHAFAGGNASPQQAARAILDAAGVKGGLIIHLGCGDGKLTAALAESGSYLVHGLDTSVKNVETARIYLRDKGLYGPVCVDTLAGQTLPYIENLANLVIAEDLSRISMQEVMRVLCPNGVAYVKQNGKWTKTVKPRPAEIDDWTHYLHNSTNNAVSNDTVVAPPRHLQWVGSPKWSRHHERMASMNALVSAGGRLFYIFDEGATASVMTPSKRMLIARDAFNGTILWKRPLESWHDHMWPFKSGPTQLTRRLIASEDTVYVTLGIDQPLTAIDAATGKTKRTFTKAGPTEEVIAVGGMLLLQINQGAVKDFGFKPVLRSAPGERNRVATEFPWDAKDRIITAVDPDSGKILWTKKTPIVPMTLAADDKNVVFHNGESLICLKRKNGRQTWQSEPVSIRSSIPMSFGPTLVIDKDAVLFSGGENSLASLSLKSGKLLWQYDKPPSGHNCPEDVLIAGGLVWAGATAKGADSGIFTGRDPVSGEIGNEFPPDVDTHWFHQRCYRSKATVNYLLPSRTGIEFVDFRKDHWEPHHWVRGGCIYGIMPANGMVYAPMHSCACYIDAKLNGFCALAPESKTRTIKPSQANRLQVGPAYNEISNIKYQISNSSSWPTYRADQARSGFADTAVPADLKQAWKTQIGGNLTSVTIAQGKLFVADIDTHTLYALDESNGNILWTFTAGGRIDSPPTIHNGAAIFGSHDGSVYSLRASDGALAWRFLAAPTDQRHVAFEQVESLWPVHGSVLVKDDIVHCIAGRSMFLDSGLRLIRLDYKTGRKISESILDDIDPDTGENLQVKVKTLNMPTSLPDILSSDGEHLYMRTQQFDLTGKRTTVAATDGSDQSGGGKHLFSGAGFLDGTGFHRAYYIYGNAISSGAGGWHKAGKAAPAGQLLVMNENNIYGFGRKAEYYRWSVPLEYHIFASEKEPQVVPLTNHTVPEDPPAAASSPADTPRARLARARAANQNDDTTPAKRSRRPKLTQTANASSARTKKAKTKTSGGSSATVKVKFECDWTKDTTILARAMVLADETIFIAGPPDMVDEEQLFDNFQDPQMQKKAKAQDAAMNDKKGAILMAISTKNGKKLAQYELDSMPTWDAMAAANNRLYIATEKGNIICME